MSLYQALLVSAPPNKTGLAPPRSVHSRPTIPSSVCPAVFCPALPAAWPFYLALIVSFHSLPRRPFSPVRLSRLAMNVLTRSAPPTPVLSVFFSSFYYFLSLSRFPLVLVFPSLLQHVCLEHTPSTYSSTPPPPGLPSPFNRLHSVFFLFWEHSCHFITCSGAPFPTTHRTCSFPSFQLYVVQP